MTTRKNKTIKFWYSTPEEAVIVQINNLPIAKAQERAIEVLQERGFAGANKKNVKKVEAKNGNV